MRGTNISVVRFIHFIIFLLLISLIVSGCAEEHVPVTVKNNLPDQQFRNSRIIVTENGITTAIVMANRVSVYEERNYTVVEDSIAIEFFNKEGEKVSTLTALSGQVWGLYEKVDSLRATGDVVIISDERNATMETPVIRWIASTHMIYADSTVRLSTEDAVQEGVRFVATDDLKSYTMENVTGVIQGEGIAIPER